MKLPRDIQGRDFANHLIRRWNLRELRQTGSHIVLRMEIPVPYTVSIPAHKPLRLGTFRDLLFAIAEKKSIAPEALLRGI